MRISPDGLRSTGGSATYEKREARYLISGDPRALWPELSEGSFFAAMEVIADITGSALLSPSERAVLRLPDGVSARLMGIVAFASGMGPLLGHWLETGQVTADARTAEILAQHLNHGRRRAERIRSLLTRLLDGLDSAGVETVLLKGSHLAHSYYPDPGTRPMSDIDLLVPASGVAAAEKVLGAMEFTPDWASGHATSWVSGPRIVSLEYDHADNPLKIDLHTSLDRRVQSSSARFDYSLEADTVPFDHVGSSARVLRPALLTWYLSTHVAAHFAALRLVQLVDLVLVSRAMRNGDAWREFLERIDGVGQHRFAYPGLALAERLTPDSVPPEVLKHLGRHTPARIHRVVDRRTPATTQRLFHSSIKEQLVWADSPWSGLRFIAVALVPRRLRVLRHKVARWRF